MAKIEWEKTFIYFFSTFGSKINEFEQKKLEKTEKIPKTQKVAGKYMAVARSENPGGGIVVLGGDNVPPLVEIWLKRIYKPHYDYQNFSLLANGTDLN